MDPIQRVHHQLERCAEDFNRMVTLKDIVQMYMLVGVYVAPIVYFVDWVPKSLRMLIYLNPITYFIECFHDAGYYGGIRSPLEWSIAAGLAAVSLATGATVFYRLKPHFGSYL